MTLRRVMRLEDLLSGERVGVTVDGVPVLLVRDGDEVRAFEDRCAHRGVPLSTGCFRGDRATCGAHGWEYDTRTGEGVNPRSAKLNRLPLRVEDGEIRVDVSGVAPARPVEPPPACVPRPAERPKPVPEAASSVPAGGVGPVLMAGPIARALVAAIRRENPGAVVIDRGAYLRVMAAGRCSVSAAAVAGELGGPFRLPGDLEKVMVSFQGRFSTTEERAEWSG